MTNNICLIFFLWTEWKYKQIARELFQESADFSQTVSLVFVHMGVFKSTVKDTHILIEHGSYNPPFWYLPLECSSVPCDVCRASLPILSWSCKDPKNGLTFFKSFLCDGCKSADAAGTDLYQPFGVGEYSLHRTLQHATTLVQLGDCGLRVNHEPMPPESEPLQGPFKTAQMDCVASTVLAVCSTGNLLKDRYCLPPLDKRKYPKFKETLKR